MRIVAGAFKGRSIVAPKGRNTRPTADRTRESIFNVLAHASWAPSLDGVRVIDLFAGSGALGFEALSRGASFALFVETDAAARGAIRENAEALGAMGITRIHRRDATALGEKPAGLGAPFDLAFLDPPYGQGLVAPALEMLAGGAWLSDEAIAVVETGADEDDVSVEGFTVEDVRTYGEAKVSFLKRSV
jgi:16S rRNA (guanine966-N2)-methyltransferase